MPAHEEGLLKGFIDVLLTVWFLITGYVFLCNIVNIITYHSYLGVILVCIFLFTIAAMAIHLLRGLKNWLCDW